MTNRPIQWTVLTLDVKNVISLLPLTRVTEVKGVNCDL